MILWSIQHERAYEKMRKTGVLRADRNFILEDGFGDSYLWMVEQMKKRIGEPLLTIEVADELVLLSDFDYWHCVLNDGEIIFPYDAAAVYSEEEKRKSWENIFDISCSFDGEVHQSLSTQATMWEIKSEWVKKVEHFVSR